jgi:branched-chain amino acid transport system permease protein
MAFFAHVFLLSMIFCILAVSLDLLVGHTGVLAVCQAGFFGIGAYCSGLLVLKLSVPFLIGILVGVVLAVLASLVVSLSSLRLRGDYFVIATFGFQIILFSVFDNWMDVTRGPLGIAGIPPPTVLGWRVNSPWGLAVVGTVFAVFAYLVVWRLAASPFGRVLHAIREDEVFARALGKNALYFKVMSFAVSAALAALAGSLYAHYVTYIDPTSFTVLESISVISMVVIGGAGSPWGPLVGSAVLVVLPEVMRFIGLPTALAANLRQVLYGGLLVLMMIVRPRGLVGRYGFSK